MKKVTLLILLLGFITNIIGQSKKTESQKVKQMKLVGYGDADGEPIINFIDVKTKSEYQLSIIDKEEIGNQIALKEIYKSCNDENGYAKTNCKIIGQDYLCTFISKLVDIYEYSNEEEYVKTGKKRKEWVLTKLIKFNNLDAKKEIKKVLTQEEIETLLIEKTREIIFNGSGEYGFYKSYSLEPKYNELLSIKITHRISNKDRATLYNLDIEKKKKELNTELERDKEKRKELKTKFPENFVFNEENCFCNSCGTPSDTVIAYCDFRILTKKIIENTRRFDYMDDEFLNDELWKDETKNRFFIEVTTLPINNGLDDNKPEVRAYFGFYNNQEDSVYTTIPSDDFINRTENNYERDPVDFNSNALIYLNTIFLDKEKMLTN